MALGTLKAPVRKNYLKKEEKKTLEGLRRLGNINIKKSSKLRKIYQFPSKQTICAQGSDYENERQGGGEARVLVRKKHYE